MMVWEGPPTRSASGRGWRIRWRTLYTNFVYNWGHDAKSWIKKEGSVSVTEVRDMDRWSYLVDVDHKDLAG